MTTIFSREKNKQNNKNSTVPGKLLKPCGIFVIQIFMMMSAETVYQTLNYFQLDADHTGNAPNDIICDH